MTSSNHPGHRIVVALAAAFAGCVLAAGCSSSGGSGKPAAAGPSGNAGHAAGTVGNVGSGGGKGTCAKLTKADVQPLLTTAIATVKVTAVGVNGEGQQCVFGGADSSGAIDVIVVGGKNAATYYAQDVRGISEPVSVSGIGDKATRDKSGSSSGIDAMGGGLFCTVSTGASDGIPGVAKLEQAAGDTADIGDTAYATIATALGTLCNRVFGRGNMTPDLSSLISAAATASAAPTDGGGLPTDFSLPTDASS